MTAHIHMLAEMPGWYVNWRSWKPRTSPNRITMIQFEKFQYQRGDTNAPVIFRRFDWAKFVLNDGNKSGKKKELRDVTMY